MVIQMIRVYTSDGTKVTEMPTCGECKHKDKRSCQLVLEGQYIYDEFFCGFGEFKDEVGKDEH